MAAVGSKSSGIIGFFQKHLGRLAYNQSGFNQLGLYRDDMLDENEEVEEALKRLPDDVYYARQFRIKRALHLSLKKIVLPKEQWIKYEEDVHYLRPYLDEVLREKKEKENWYKQ